LIDLSSIVVVSDPSNRDVISAQMVNIYQQDALQDQSTFNDLNVYIDDIFKKDKSPVRTDTALRLLPMLSADDLKRLSDNELKDFLRNLPLLPSNSNTQHGPDKSFDFKFNTLENALNLTPDADSKKPWSPVSTGSDHHQSDEHLSYSLQPLTDDVRAKAFAPDDAVSDKDATLSVNESLSDSMIASLLFTATVARKRGWNIGGSAKDEESIYGDLQELRGIQQSKQYDVWKKRDRSEDN